MFSPWFKLFWSAPLGGDVSFSRFCGASSAAGDFVFVFKTAAAYVVFAVYGVDEDEVGDDFF